MKLEQQVCSLELAEKLKALGVKQEAQGFYWTDQGNGRVYLNGSGIPVAQAFSVAELGEMLPHWVYTIKNFPQMPFFLCRLDDTHDAPKLEIDYASITKSDTEADARAKMLIYLIEQGIVKPQEVI